MAFPTSPANGQTHNEYEYNSTEGLWGRLQTIRSTRVHGEFYKGVTDPVSTDVLNYDGYLKATRIYNAVWNDIVDLVTVPVETNIIPGKVYISKVDGQYFISDEYCQKGIIGIASDTYGFCIGEKQDEYQLPIAIGGFVLAYVDEKYEPGTPLTTSLDGGLTEIKLEDKQNYPERIIGTFWKTEEKAEWNGLKVNGRSWIKIK